MPISESLRMRNRLHMLFFKVLPDTYFNNFFYKLQSELGIKFLHNNQAYSSYNEHQYYVDNIDEFYSRNELRDILDASTILFNFLDEKSKYTHLLVTETNRIFREENIHFQMDDKGIIHPSPDEEYERNRTSTLKALESNSYESSLSHFQNADRHLLEEKYDTAIREIFLSAEAIAKKITNKDTLNEALCRKNLCEAAVNALSSNEHSKTMIESMMNGYALQIKGYHQFRHAQETANNATQEIAVLAISNFTTFIRFLIEIDQKLNPESN